MQQSSGATDFLETQDDMTAVVSVIRQKGLALGLLPELDNPSGSRHERPPERPPPGAGPSGTGIAAGLQGNLPDMEANRAGATIWFTGLSGAGKTTAARLVSDILRRRGVPTELLDGDLVRENLSKGLGFSKADRDTNVRRIGWVCELLSRHGVFVCAAAISPYEAVRNEVRSKIARFALVHCTAPLDVLEARDVKGLYRRARAGQIQHFTGIDDPYEAPASPDVTIHSDGSEIPQSSAERVVEMLERMRWLPAG
jgi:adenylylsulfate kinase